MRFLVDDKVQIRGQQAVDQSPIDVGGGTLRGITVEGDEVTTTAYSGSPLNHVRADHSTNGLWSMHTDKESLASWEGACSPIHISTGIHENEGEHTESVNFPWVMNVHPPGVTIHTGDTEITSSLRET